MHILRNWLYASLALICLMAGAFCAEAAQTGLIKEGRFLDQNTLELDLSVMADQVLPTLTPQSFRINEVPSPDVALAVSKIMPAPVNQPNRIRLVMAQPMETGENHHIVMTTAEGSSEIIVSQSKLALVFAIFISALLINNFVFSRYLGLCIFFGVSQRRSTAVGMGITFTVVMVAAAVMCWAVYQFIMKPLHLDFMQVIVFIGITAVFVQAVDTILRKINPVLFKRLGVYLVLITVNCIILTVPLMLADQNYDLIESLMLALGAGLGFALAMYLMASVRERLEVARVPEMFQGLPIAFIVTGFFALSFMGFSGLTFF